MANGIHQYAFAVGMKKRSGSGPLDTAQRNLLCTDVAPENPDNNGYIPVINSSVYPSVVSAGKKSPRVAIHSCLKPRNGSVGWSNADVFNSLVQVDGTNNTDSFAFGFADETETRIYDFGRCDRLDFSGNAQGGVQACSMMFAMRWGDQDGPYNSTLGSGEVIGAAPSFTLSAQTPDAGLATPSSSVACVGLDTVMSYQLSLIRGQAPRYYFDASLTAPGSPGPSGILSTMFSGLLTVEQEGDASTQIANTGTVVLGFNNLETSSTGRFKITMLVKRDNRFKQVVTRIGTVVTTFSLIDLTSGGNPAVIVSY